MTLSKPKEKNGVYELKSYIIDTVAFLAYLADVLPKKADDIFKKAEKKQAKLLLPSIALGETLYTIYKGKAIFGKVVPLEKIELIFQILRDQNILELICLDLEGWRIFHGLNISELHDRMIVASFKLIKAESIVTNDPEISEQFSTIWD
jgi:predicted nucleic acid-binding protein